MTRWFTDEAIAAGNPGYEYMADVARRFSAPGAARTYAPGGEAAGDTMKSAIRDQTASKSSIPKPLSDRSQSLCGGVSERPSKNPSTEVLPSEEMKIRPMPVRMLTKMSEFLLYHVVGG